MAESIIELKYKSRYVFLKKIFEVLSSRKAKKIMSIYSIRNQNEIDTIKKALISICLNQNLKTITNELTSNEKFRKYLKIDNIRRINNIYNTLHNIQVNDLERFVYGILNKYWKNNTNHIFIIDSITVKISINNKPKIFYRNILKNDVKTWSTSLSYRVTLVIESETKIPVYFTVDDNHKNSVSNISKLMKELKRRHIVKKGDKIYFDKKYYSYENYTEIMRNYNIKPLILTKENFNKKKLRKKLTPPMDNSKLSKKNQKIIRKQFYKSRSELIRNLENDNEIKNEIKKIEYLFKILRNELDFKNLNKCTMNSMRKHTALTVLLLGLIMANKNLKLYSL